MSDLSVDAVVVGSGHNSLACAVHLLARGWSVAVLERAEVPGGAVRSGEYTAPGFRHDWAAMNLSLFAGSPFYKAYQQDLHGAGLDFAPVEACFASVFPDGKWLGICKDAAANRRAIAAFSEADAAAWEALGAAFPQEAAHLFSILGQPMKKGAIARSCFRLLRERGVGGSLDFARFLAASPRAWLEETFTSSHVRATLAAWGMHLDFAPDIAGGALFPYLESMANQAFGMVLGKGGADSLTNALLALIDARGGKVMCGAEVARITHSGGSADGVVLSDGRTISAQRAVIANVAPAALGRMIGESGDPAYEAGLTRFRHAPGTMMIHLALSDLPDWRADAALREYAYVHIAPSLDQMALAYQQAMAGLLPAEPVLVVGQPTAIDPSRAPEGKHVLWVQVRMAPGEIAGDGAGQIAARDWSGAAEPFAERALNLIEYHAPGLHQRILARRIVSPADLEADNPNLVGGDQLCGSHHLSQHFFYRPQRGRSDGSTPIARLHHTGAAVWPGAGTGAGPGYLLARRLAGP